MLRGRGVRGQRLGVLNVGRPPLFIKVLLLRK